ncbi:hypothetical protein TRSC58_02680 [Trypanosoma rangeli SC58]|uniref:Uncharacterized protein n=1 Tax=Trypanosoma rangeli SC58 TaxID=429131 RepID=A0A061J8L6_TRYRA|nr:hypothetical protein TRSC58_02680 [Trypanosoma rangeli SC58]
MKVVVRGMRRTGKSTIVSRLCGYTPHSGYTPSPEISAGTIFYRSCAGRTRIGGGGGFESTSGGGAKVELWDVVDEGFSASQPASTTPHPTLADARSIDVYGGCQLAAFVVDRTRSETLEYAVREARHAPPNTCVIFILNFYDAPRYAHAVSERDIDAACKSLRRATTPMILAAAAGRLPPEDYSVAATWVSISAATGHGMDLLRNAFEIPYALLKVSTLEARIHTCFQFVEEYRTWMVSERAKFLLQEQVKEDVLQGSENKPLEATSCSLLRRGADAALPRGGGRGSSTLNIIGVNRVHCHVEEDENVIAKDFFNNVDKEEDAAGYDAKASGDRRSSSRSDGGQRNCKRSPAESPIPTAPLSSLPLSQSTPKLASSISRGDLGATTPAAAAAAASVPVTVIDEGGLQMYMPDEGFRNFADDVLDVGDNHCLDGNFFGSDHSGDTSSNHGLEAATDDSSDEGYDVFKNSNACLCAPLKMAKTSMDDAPTESYTPSIYADVSVLLQQMQIVLGNSVEEEGAPQRHHDKQKSRFRHKKRDTTRSKRRHHHVGQVEGSKGVKNTLSDDGTFEVIRE